VSLLVQSRVEEMLATIPLFSTLDISTLLLLSSLFRFTTVRKGTEVVVEGDFGDCMYVICEGTLGVYSADEDGTVMKLASDLAVSTIVQVLVVRRRRRRHCSSSSIYMW
jgi:hypothetical protein